MSQPDDPSGGALKQFSRRLGAFEAARQADKRPGAGIGGEAGEGYRLLGTMLGGVLGGVGLGWLIDHFAGTGPWGMVCGLAIGLAASLYATARAASRISARVEAKARPPAPQADDEDGDE